MIHAREPVAPDGAAGQAVAALSVVLRILADATRFSIYQQLRQGETCVCELAATLGLAENLVSHHLGVLRRAGLVHDRRDPSDARWVYYQLDADALARVHAELGALFDPRGLGTRTPTCGPAALIAPRRAPPRARGDRLPAD